MVTLTNAENALKTVYLGAVTELLNTKANPLLSKIEQTAVDVWGKEVRTAARVGINGGVGAGDEAGNLPGAYGSNYIQCFPRQNSISEECFSATEAASFAR